MELDPKEHYTLTVELLANKPIVDDPLMNSTTVSPMYYASAVGDDQTDYDELPTNYTNNDAIGGTNGDVKVKTRRFWNKKEEQCFFEIWGRENWRLTKYGKNTIYFAQWAEELKEKYNIDVKPEEIQCKVNQTRAKYRQVKKLIDTDKTHRWKKYDIVERILKNQYRSKNDEPVPLEALENNRDMSPGELMITNTLSTSPTTSLHEVADLHLSQNNNQHGNIEGNLNHNLITMNSGNGISLGIFNNDSQAPDNYNREIIDERIDIKAEIEEDLRKEEELIIDCNYRNPCYRAASSPNAKAVSNLNNYCQRPTPLQMQVIPIQQPQQAQTQRFQQEYVNQLLQQQQQQQQSPAFNSNSNPLSHNNNHFRASIPANAIVKIASTSNASPLPNSTTVSGTNIASKYIINNNVMKESVPIPRLTTPASFDSLKRQGTSLQVMQPSNGISSDGGDNDGKVVAIKSLEAQYLEEVRKKNIILQEQRDISRKRLDLEKRKLTLLEEFFPKYMNVQQQILCKLNSCFNITTDNSVNNPQAD